MSLWQAFRIALWIAGGIGVVAGFLSLWIWALDQEQWWGYVTLIALSLVGLTLVIFGIGSFVDFVTSAEEAR